MSKKSDWFFLSLLRILASEVVWVCLGSVPKCAKSPAGFPLWQGQGSSPSQSQRPERPLAEGPGIVSLLCPDEIWHGNSSLAYYVDECFADMSLVSHTCRYIILISFSIYFHNHKTVLHRWTSNQPLSCMNPGHMEMALVLFSSLEYLTSPFNLVHTVYLNFWLLWNPILILIVQSFQTIPNLHLPQSTSIYFLHVLCFYLQLFLLSNHLNVV